MFSFLPLSSSTVYKKVVVCPIYTIVFLDLLFNQIVLILIYVEAKKILNHFHPHSAFLFEIRLDALGSGEENPPQRF